MTKMVAATKGPYLKLNDPTHSTHIVKNLCSLLERQSLVDILIFCGNQSLRTHKFILAANSPLFAEEFQKNPDIEQVIMGGMDFAVVKCLVEYMYSGRTIITEEHFKYFKAAVKLLEIQPLEKHFLNDADDLYLPKPQFLTKKPNFFMANSPNKSTLLPATITSNMATVTNAKQHQREQNNKVAKTSYTIKSPQENLPIKQILPTHVLKPANMRGKRVLKKQVEQAFLKEAQASRLALTNLQKEIGSTSQTVNFIVEETCAETCMENFIPQTEENPTYLETLEHIKKENPRSNNSFDEGQNHFDKDHIPTHNLENIFNNQNPSDVEIMYKNNEERFAAFNKQILENLTPENLPYQVLYQNGNLKMQDPINGIENKPSNLIPKNGMECGNFLNDTGNSFNDGLCSIVTNLSNECPRSAPTTSGLGQPTMEVADYTDLTWL